MSSVKDTKKSGPPWLEIAGKDMADHVKEEPGPRNHPRIIQMGSYTALKATSDEIPWCSSAVCAWMEESGIRSTRSAAARSWLKWGIALAEPRLGCVVVSRRGDNPAQGHVSLYLGEEERRVIVIGGNQHDCVCLAGIPKTDVLGYRWPRLGDYREPEKEKESAAGGAI